MRPIFLVYKKVSWEGHRIPIVDVATVVTAAIESADQINGIQAMKAGWNIYMKSEVDRVALLLVGINLAGRHVSLAPSWHEHTESIKSIIKDLPLHKVSNQNVLAVVKELFSVLSDVKYSNVFVDGRKTHLQNGDIFLYISPDQLDKVPAMLTCQAFVARIVKPVKFQTCHRYGQIGHKASSSDCPGLAPEEVQQTIQPFCGG